MAIRGFSASLLLPAFLFHFARAGGGEAGICESAVRPKGYKCQEIEVTTGDGYILGVQRIAGRWGGGGGGAKQPVLLQHGVLMDGMTWLMNSPEQSLAFILADNGFDVWVTNTRGTQSSRRHVSLPSSDPAYWAWSWDELAANELPTMINLVFKQTGQRLHYVGHSLGTLIALASFSEGRDVDKLRSAALLCPVAYLDHMKTLLGILAARVFLGEILSKLLGLAEFDPRGIDVTKCLDNLCKYPGVNCFDLISSFTGKNCCLNASTVEQFLKYEPQPTSTKNMVHFAQSNLSIYAVNSYIIHMLLLHLLLKIIENGWKQNQCYFSLFCCETMLLISSCFEYAAFRDGTLRKYDYENRLANTEKYGQSTPPPYNLSNIPHSLPIYLSYGGRDSLSDAQDVARLLDDLKHHDSDKLIVHYVPSYAHADFVMGVSAKQAVYDSMIAFFKHLQ